MPDKKVTEEPGEAAFRAGPPRERTPLRDNLEAIVIAVVLVLCVRQMVVEAFRIRHGSMAPTLAGDHHEVRCVNCAWVFNVGDDKVGRQGYVECPNCRYTWPGAGRFDDMGRPLSFRWPAWLWNSAELPGGDSLTGMHAANRIPRGAARIFVNKFVYRLREPRRWEVAVFIYPVYSAYCPICDWRGHVHEPGVRCPDCGAEELQVTARNFIKRIAGLPGETVALEDGDVFIGGAVARKPRDVQEDLWFHVYDSHLPPREEVVPTWDLSAAPDRWTREPPGGALLLDALGAQDSVMGEFGREIRDFYAYDGVSYEQGGGIGSAGRNTVGDVRIRAQVEVEEADPDGRVELAIRDAGRIFRLSVGTSTDATAELYEWDTMVRRVDVPGIVPGQSRRLTLENYDDRVVAKLDGREVLSYDYARRTASEHGLSFGARGARVLWKRIQIQRDVYYASVNGRPDGYRYELGEDEYFVLGDNSPASDDSRRWDDPGIPARNMIGRAMFVFWPVHQMKWLAAPAGLEQPAEPPVGPL